MSYSWLKLCQFIFGAECWPSSKNHQQLLKTLEMRMLESKLSLSILDHVPNNATRKTLGEAPDQEKMRKVSQR